jgi:hypothetical protein
MLAMAIITVVCVCSMVFLLRFFIALCKEPKTSRYVLEVQDDTEVLGGCSQQPHSDRTASRIAYKGRMKPLTVVRRARINRP